MEAIDDFLEELEEQRQRKLCCLSSSSSEKKRKRPETPETIFTHRIVRPKFLPLGAEQFQETNFLISIHYVGVPGEAEENPVILN